MAGNLHRFNGKQTQLPARYTYVTLTAALIGYDIKEAVVMSSDGLRRLWQHLITVALADGQ